jgi:hypothetical protein
MGPFANRFAGKHNCNFPNPVKRGNVRHPVVLSLNILSEKCSQFCRQPISKSVVIGDVPIVIRECEGEREQQPCRSWAIPKVLHFQRLTDRFNCLCYKELTKRVPQNVLHQAILSSSMTEHPAANRLPAPHSPRRPVSVHSHAIYSRSGACRLGKATALLYTYPAEQMIAWPVTTAMGSVNNNDLRLIRRTHSRKLLGTNL